MSVRLGHIIYFLSEFLTLEEIVAIASCCKLFNVFTNSDFFPSISMTTPLVLNTGNLRRLERYLCHARDVKMVFPLSSPGQLTLHVLHNILKLSPALRTLNISNANITGLSHDTTSRESSSDGFSADNSLLCIGLQNVTCSKSALYVFLMGAHRLQYLKLSSCVATDDRIIDVVLSQSLSLKKLCIDRCLEITRICYSSSKARVTQCDVTKCPRLKHFITNGMLISCNVSNTAITTACLQQIVNYECGSLRSLSADSCSALTTLVLQSCSLQHLSVNNCRALTSLTLHIPSLLTLSVHNCLRLENIDARVRCLPVFSAVCLGHLQQLHLSSLCLHSLDITGCGSDLEQSVHDLKRIYWPLKRNEHAGGLCVDDGGSTQRPRGYSAMSGPSSARKSQPNRAGEGSYTNMRRGSRDSSFGTSGTGDDTSAADGTVGENCRIMSRSRPCSACDSMRCSKHDDFFAIPPPFGPAVRRGSGRHQDVASRNAMRTMTDAATLIDTGLHSTDVNSAIAGYNTTSAVSGSSSYYMWGERGPESLQSTERRHLLRCVSVSPNLSLCCPNLLVENIVVCSHSTTWEEGDECYHSHRGGAHMGEETNEAQRAMCEGVVDDLAVIRGELSPGRCEAKVMSRRNVLL